MDRVVKWLEEKYNKVNDWWNSRTKNQKIGFICIAPTVLLLGGSLVVALGLLFWVCPPALGVLIMMGLFVYGLNKLNV